MAAEAKLVITAEANTQKAQQELNKLKGAGIKTADDIGKANRQAAKSPLAMAVSWAFAIGLVMKGVRALAKGFAELVKRGKQVEESAKKLSLSVETYSALEARAKRAGVSTEQFNAQMAKLKDGKATLDEISAGFAKIGTNAKVAGDIAKDVFARQMARVSDAVKGAWESFAQGAVKFFTFSEDSKLGLLGYPSIDASIESGESRADAIKRAAQQMGGVTDGERVSALGTYYDSRKLTRDAEQLRSEMRLAASYMKDIGDEGRAREAWQKYTGKTVSEERFRAFVEQGKEKPDKYADILAQYKDAPKGESEKEKVEKGAMFEGAFTYGGGALDGLTYAFLADCQGSYEYEQVKALREIKKQNDKGVQTLGEISKTLKGE